MSRSKKEMHAVPARKGSSQSLAVLVLHLPRVGSSRWRWGRVLKDAEFFGIKNCWESIHYRGSG